MTQILQPYKIPIAYGDLSQAETLEDVFYALDNLSGTIDDIFTKIEKRLQDERKRVDQIKLRVSTCKGKVDMVRGSNQATTVFSTSKFPAPKSLPTYPTLFSQITDMRNPYRDVNDEVQYLPANPSTSAVGNRELSSEMVEIMQRLNGQNTDIERVEFIMEDNGLGPIPFGINSTSSMLLFNSNINPYKDYQTLDNLISAGREKTTEEDTAKALASAPSTLISGEALPDIQQLDLLFKPQMGEMSSLALPENLPLDFIAGNISFGGVDLPSIAPSAHGRANYNLPQITDGGVYASAPSAKQPKNAKASAPPPPPASSGPPPPPPGASAPPPPPPGGSAPPPPPPGAPMASGPPPAPVATAGPPPPPVAAAGPPPPPVAAASMNDIDEDEGGAAPAPAGTRVNLMDAIRGANFNKLRSKEESSLATAKVQKKVEAAKPLSMAEALKQRLARRNDALSGKVDKEAARRDSAVIAAARAVPKVKPLATVGFASVDDNDNKKGGGDESDDDSLNQMATRKSFGGNKNTADDSDSDVSEMSEDSRKPAGKPFSIPPPTKITAPVAKPTTPTPVPAANERGKSGGGLLDTNNKALSSMLQKASKKHKGSDSESGDDWD